MYKTSPKGDFIRKCAAEVLADGKTHQSRELYDYTIQKAIGTEFEGKIIVSNISSYLVTYLPINDNVIRISRGVYQSRAAYDAQMEEAIRESRRRNRFRSRWRCDDDCDNWWQD